LKKELGSLNNLQVDLKGNSAAHPKFAAGLDELVVHSDNLTDLFTRPATEACILHARAVSAAGLETDVDFDQWLQDAADEVTIVSVMIVFFFAWPFFQVTNSRLKRAELGAVLKEFKKRQPQKFTCLLSMWHFSLAAPRGYK